MKSTDFTIREATEADAEQLINIYSPYVTQTAITFEYDVPSVTEFRNRISHTKQKYPYIVAVNGQDQITGYAYASPINTRKAYDHSAELSIYLQMDCRGHGLGTMLYSKMEELLLAQGITNLYACVAATSRFDDKYLTDASLLFHKARGFSVAGVFTNCGYKFNQWYNMTWLEKILVVPEHRDAEESVVECFDIYDENRRPNARVMERGSKSMEGDYHNVIHVCIFNSKGEMLIQQRTGNKNWPNLWDFSVGGHVIAGETSARGAEREVREELGLCVNITGAPRFTVGFENGFDDYFVVEKDIEIGELRLQKEEVQNACFASRDRIIEMIRSGAFICYHESIVNLIFDTKDTRGAHRSCAAK